MVTNIIKVPEGVYNQFAELFDISPNSTFIVLNSSPGKPYVKLQKDNTINNLMTREEARKKVFDKVKNLEGRECGELVEALEALGLIKFKKEIEDEWMIKAQKYLDNKIIQYDALMPIDTITEMSKVISYLYRKVKGE